MYLFVVLYMLYVKFFIALFVFVNKIPCKFAFAKNV